MADIVEPWARPTSGVALARDPRRRATTSERIDIVAAVLDAPADVDDDRLGEVIEEFQNADAAGDAPEPPDLQRDAAAPPADDAGEVDDVEEERDDREVDDLVEDLTLLDDDASEDLRDDVAEQRDDRVVEVDGLDELDELEARRDDLEETNEILGGSDDAVPTDELFTSEEDAFAGANDDAALEGRGQLVPGIDVPSDDLADLEI